MHTGHDVVDVGAYELSPEDDYPDVIIPLTRAVAAGDVFRGIAICGSGVGASVCANKVVGVRAGLVHDHMVRRTIQKPSKNLFSLAAALHEVATELEELKLPHPNAAGHRLVHGGPNHVAPARVTDVLSEELRAMIPFAPLHLPAEIAGIDCVTSRFPDMPQVACFDTALHRSMPEVAQRFSLPRAIWDEGIRRYGFHGISYEYIMGTLGPTPPARVIIAHLGSGASMAAVKYGSPVDTTMGFTPSGGFMMGTRSGDLDPGVLLYFLRQKSFDAEQLERFVNGQSGLLGVSGLSSDMRSLLERQATDSHAALAVEMFCYQIRKQVGALSAVLGGLDFLVFTGGIGEKAAPVRWDVCQGLEQLGIKLDPERNDANADTISASNSQYVIRVIPTNEDLMIARHTYRLLSPASSETGRE